MSPSRQHLYRVSSSPPKYGEALKRPQCLTCSQAELDKRFTTTSAPPRLVTDWDDDWENGDDGNDEVTLPYTTPIPKRKRSRKDPQQIDEPIPCQFHEATFAPGPHSLALIECLGPIIPHSAIYRLPLEFHNQKPLQPIFHLQNNTLLREHVAQIALPQIKTFPVLISGGYHAHVRLLLPPGLREDEITRYPMIVHV